MRAAASYAVRGIAVFPCWKKIPLTGPGGFKNATCDSGQIAKWWIEHPNAQIAVPTGKVNHLFVVDVDGPKGAAAFARLNLPETFTVETSPGRYHMWFWQEEGLTSDSRVHFLGPQIDTRGDKGYVIAPPSIHHTTGTPYKIVKNLPWALAPTEILQPQKSRASQRSTTISDVIPRGRRHDILLRIAGALRARLSPEMVLAQLRTVNERQCHPPLEDSEVQELAEYVGSQPAGFPARLPPGGLCESELELESYDRIPREHLRFIWPQYLPVGKLVHLAGHSTEGKTPILTDLAARISVGASWPDGAPNTLGPRSVLLLSAEDDAGDTLRPRLEMAGADLKKIHRVRATVRSEQGPQEKMLALDRDWQKLVGIARTLPDLALIGIDPVTNYLGTGVRINAEDEVRPILMPLSLGAAELNITIITIGHLNRREKGTEAMHRILGAAAFAGVARFVYLVGPDPDDENKYAHVLLQRRGVGAPTLRYVTFMAPVTWDGETSDVLGLAWKGRSLASAQDLVDPQGGEEKSSMNRAAGVLREILRAGPVAAKDAQAQLQEAGVAPEINTTRLLRAAGATSRRLPNDKRWSWFLQTGCQE